MSLRNLQLYTSRSEIERRQVPTRCSKTAHMGTAWMPAQHHTGTSCKDPCLEFVTTGIAILEVGTAEAAFHCTGFSG